VNIEVQGQVAPDELGEQFFKNPVDKISRHFENMHKRLVVDQQIIRHRLVDAYTNKAVVELFFPGDQRLFLCQLMEQDRTILDEYEQEHGEALCCLTGMDAMGGHPASIVISPLEPRIGNLQITKASRVVLRIFLGKHAYEYGTYFKGRAIVNGCQGLVLDMPVISQAINNVRLYRVNLTNEYRFPVKVSLDGSDSEYSSQALNISAEGIAFEIPENLQRSLDNETVVSLALAPLQASPTNLPAVIRNHNRVRNANAVEEFCGVQFAFPNAWAASYMGELSATIQRYQIRQNRVFQGTAFRF